MTCGIQQCARVCWPITNNGTILASLLPPPTYNYKDNVKEQEIDNDHDHLDWDNIDWPAYYHRPLFNITFVFSVLSHTMAMTKTKTRTMTMTTTTTLILHPTFASSSQLSVTPCTHFSIPIPFPDYSCRWSGPGLLISWSTITADYSREGEQEGLRTCLAPNCSCRFFGGQKNEHCLSVRKRKTI